MTQQPVRPKPLPQADFDTEPFWAALRAHELQLQRCADCRQAYFYPRILCPFCWSTNVLWERMSGLGSIYTYSVVHRAPSPAFSEDVPYVVAVVELDEGPRLPVNIVEWDESNLSVGARVEVIYEDVNDTVTLARFRPVKG